MSIQCADSDDRLKHYRSSLIGIASVLPIQTQLLSSLEQMRQRQRQRQRGG